MKMTAIASFSVARVNGQVHKLIYPENLYIYQVSMQFWKQKNRLKKCCLLAAILIIGGKLKI